MTENVNANSAAEDTVEMNGNAEKTKIKDELNPDNGEINDTETETDKKTLQKEAAEFQEKYDELYDKYLRVTAEYENFRKRTAKEKVNIYFESTLDVMNTILPVMDNIERAVQFAETDGNNADKISEGLKMVHAQFKTSFEKLGIEEIKALGENFDPAFHNAVFHEEDKNQPENTVVDVLQKGYIKGEKVIRPAMVRVVN